MIHISDVQHYPYGEFAFPTDEHDFVLRLKVRKGCASKVTVFYADRAQECFPLSFTPGEMTRIFADDDWDIFALTITACPIRLGYYFLLASENGYAIFAGGFLYRALPRDCAEGKTIDNRSILFQYPYIWPAEIPQLPEWFRDAVVYSIFPDSFANGYRRCDGHASIISDSGCTSESRCGGTLAGITENLDYIKDLGFNCIYLNPIMASHSYHKYDIRDYRRVDPLLGSNGDFKALVGKAHTLGMRVVIDGVFNHTSDDFPAFADIKEKGAGSRGRDFYYDIKFPLLTENAAGKTSPNYACFGYVPTMPKTNTSAAAVQDFFCGVGTYWIKEFGIDGWRLDVADEISHSFWRAFRKATKAVDPEVVLIGEVWENSRAWLTFDQLDSAMNYDFRRHMADFMAFKRIDTAEFKGRLIDQLTRYEDQYVANQLNILDSHDVPRFLSLVGNDTGLFHQALAILFMFKGVPALLYGDENDFTGIFESEYRKRMVFGTENKTKTLIRSLSLLRQRIRPNECTLSFLDFPVNATLFGFALQRAKGPRYLVIGNFSGGNVPWSAKAGAAVQLSDHYRKGVFGPRGFAIIKEQ